MSVTVGLLPAVHPAAPLLTFLSTLPQPSSAHFNPPSRRLVLRSCPCCFELLLTRMLTPMVLSPFMVALLFYSTYLGSQSSAAVTPMVLLLCMKASLAALRLACVCVRFCELLSTSGKCFQLLRCQWEMRIKMVLSCSSMLLLCCH